MRTVELITLIGTLVGTIATLVSLRVRRRRGEPSPLQRWRTARAAPTSRPE